MGKIIEFKNMNFGYNNTNAFNDFSMDIEEEDIVTLIGPSGSGKTTLLKMLCHKLPNNSCYYYGRKFSTYNIQTLKRAIVIVFDLPFTEYTVKNEILTNIKKLNYSNGIIEERYDELSEIFNLEKIENNNPENLASSKKYLIKILRYLITQPKFFAIDNLLSFLDDDDKNKIIAYIKKYKITFLNVTTNLEETLYGNKIYVLENFVLILEGNTLSVLKTDTLLKRLGFKLPLAVELSIELNHYDILKKTYSDIDKLVNALWK